MVGLFSYSVSLARETNGLCAVQERTIEIGQSKKFPVMRIQFRNVLVCPLSRPSPRAVASSNLSGDGTNNPVRKVPDASDERKGLVEYYLGVFRFGWRDGEMVDVKDSSDESLPRQYQVGGQSIVRKAASSIMYSRRGLRCLTRKGACSPRSLVSHMSRIANGVDLRRLNYSSIQLDKK